MPWDGQYPSLNRYAADRTIEIFRAHEWYLDGGKFDLHRVTAAWDEKLERALGHGFPGMRVSGNTAWLDKKDWRDFMEYEEQLNSSITEQPMTVLCTYPLKTSGATELLDVARTHQFAIAKRQGIWEVLETPALKQAKTEIARLNDQLERRVASGRHSSKPRTTSSRAVRRASGCSRKPSRTRCGPTVRTT